MYHKSFPPCPPGILEAKTKTLSSTEIAGWPTVKVSSVITINSGSPHFSPALFAHIIQHPETPFFSTPHLVKNIIFFFLFKQEAPSSTRELTVSFKTVDSLHFPLLSLLVR